VVRTAVFDGQFFNPTEGKKDPRTGIPARTPWGWVACRLGGNAGYEILRKDDESQVDPGADKLMTLLGDHANLILIDEVLEFLIKAGGVRVGESYLRDQIMLFIKSLIAATDNTPRTALVFSLQSSKRESLDYFNLLQTVDHLAARKDQRREPVEGNEILSVIQRRLLAKLPTDSDAAPAATAFQETVTQMRRAYAQSNAERQQADEEGLALRDRVRASYPFHPALIDLMRERWAAIPDFQRTRGALRFLAACLRASHR
jgi:predicted AAA+ superfamily ATPase